MTRVALLAITTLGATSPLWTLISAASNGAPRQDNVIFRAWDCNLNGIVDGIDIREGMEDDINHNHQIDECDWELYGGTDLPDSGLWRSFQTKRDTSFFLTKFVGGSGVEIRYTVPVGGARVRLVVLNESGRQVRGLVRRRQAAGAYLLVWNLRDDRRRPSQAGLYSLRLEVNDHSYQRRTQWAVGWGTELIK